MYEYTVDLITPFVEFITSETALLFGLLFLNNVLMYLAITWRHNAEIKTLKESHDTTIRCANSANETLRSVVYAFSDDPHGQPISSIVENEVKKSTAGLRKELGEKKVELDKPDLVKIPLSEHPKPYCFGEGWGLEKSFNCRCSHAAACHIAAKKIVITQENV